MPVWEWVFGVATVVLALVTAVLAGVAIWLAGKTRKLTADSKRLAEESKRLSEWQRHDQELTNFKQRLEQRVGYAHALDDVAVLAVVISQFPPSPGEPLESRNARQGQATSGALSTGEEFESLVFTQQLDGRWTLEFHWGAYQRIEDALQHAAQTYMLPVQRPFNKDPMPRTLWSVGQRYLLVTRKVEQTSETQSEEEISASAPEPSEDA